MRDDARSLLHEALTRTAHRLDDTSADAPGVAIGETAHLRPSLMTELKSITAEHGLPAVIRREHPFQCIEWQSRAGVDVAITRLPKLAPVFCELKSGDSASTLGECSWDVAKMGLAVAKGACSAAVLIAAAPVTRWEQAGLEGPELFCSRVSPLEHIRGPLYLDKYWKYYALEGLPQPQKLPSAFMLTAWPPAEFTATGKPWELRCVEVEPAGDLVAVEQLPGPVN